MDNGKQRERYLSKIKDLRLLDDEFMTKVFDGQPELATLVIRIILGDDSLVAIKSEVQKELRNLQGHSVRLDILATDSDGNLYNIEIQRADSGAGAVRARYYSSIIDSNALDKGVEYDKLPETYVIFITENDVIGKGWPIYHIERVIMGTGELFGDREHIIYVNAAYNADDDLGKLMRDFRTADPADMNYKELAERARHFKEDTEGVKTMCRSMEELYNEGRSEGFDEGRNEGFSEGRSEERRDNIRKLLVAGLSPEMIANTLGISLTEVNSMAQ